MNDTPRPTDSGSRHRHPPARRADYLLFRPVATRWMDNDVYGHVNNVVYYSYFDTAIGEFLIARGLVDYARGKTVFVVAETGCRFRRQIAFPDRVTIGIRIARLGDSSVRYELGVFRNDEDEAAAEGHFVHVQVDRQTMRPTPISAATRAILQELVTQEE
jgi:acyl-CoA thioester hydrolase